MSGTLFPRHEDDLTAAWLTGTLRKAGVLAHASVVSLQCGPLRNAAGITGHLVRLQLEYDEPEPRAPGALVAKFSAVHPDERMLVHSMGFYEREARFYAELAPLTPIGTPRCLASEVDADSGESLILLEDLTTARNGSTVAGCSLDDARLAVEELARLHARWWATPELDGRAWLRRRGLQSPERLADVFRSSWPVFLKRLDRRSDDLTPDAGEWVARHIEALTVQLLTEPPLTLVHEDYNADNMFFPRGSDPRRLVVADWQLAEQGRGAIDLSTFLGGNLDTELRRANEQGLLASYHDALVANGVAGYSFGQLHDDYRRSMLLPAARLASAVGAHPGLVADPKAFWNTVFPRYWSALRDLEVEERLSE